MQLDLKGASYSFGNYPGPATGLEILARSWKEDIAWLDVRDLRFTCLPKAGL